MTINECSLETHALLWEPEKVDLITTNKTVRVDRWYLWNAEFNKVVVPLDEGSIK